MINDNNNKADITLIITIFAVIVVFAWLFFPPSNKIQQICYWFNHVGYFIQSATGDTKATEYKFHRNNAIYLAKMYPKRQFALCEMDKAIEKYPSSAPEKKLLDLYKDRAEIRLYLGSFKGALNDFIHSNQINTYEDKTKVAMLFIKLANYKQAMSYCNSILDTDYKAYEGYACMAEVYIAVNRADLALNVWNLAVNRSKTNADVYAGRAYVKKLIGDLKGYESDLNAAKEFNPFLKEPFSLYESTLNPSVLKLSAE